MEKHLSRYKAATATCTARGERDSKQVEPAGDADCRFGSHRTIDQKPEEPISHLPLEGDGSSSVGSCDYEGDKRDVIKEICPLLKHNNIKKSQKSATSQFQQQVSDVKPVARINTMAVEVMRMMKAARGSRPLRQVNIVGQLNHSANSGFLLIVNTMLILSLILMLQLGSNCHLTEGSVWPFNKSSLSSLVGTPAHRLQVTSPGSSNQTFKARRVARHSGSEADTPQSPSKQQQQQQQQQVPSPASQQFHYFWNHDQIEPKTLADEAAKILAEAQVQTNQIALGEDLKKVAGSSATNSQVANSRGDMMQASSSAPSYALPSTSAVPPEMVLPAAIQRQLTAMVLQMQRQQQASLLMQPRFDHLAAGGVARRFSPSASPMQLPLSPLNRFWMSASSQHPTIIAPPLHHHLLTGAESQVHGQQLAMSPYEQTMARVGSASVGGVPIFGPFLVAPPVAHPMHLAPPTQVTQTKTSSPASSSHQTATSGGRLSALSKRKSWPLIGSLVDRGSIFASSSQPQPAIAIPPATQQLARPMSQTPVPTPVDPMAIIELASQLTNVIVGQMQARAAQQKYMSLAPSSQYDPQVFHDLQASTSMLKPQTDSDRTLSLDIGQRPVRMQPPYLMQSNISPILAAYQSELLNHPNLFNLSASPDMPPFGTRIKRRHLGTQQVSNVLGTGGILAPKKESTNPPYTIFTFGNDNQQWLSEHSVREENNSGAAKHAPPVNAQYGTTTNEQTEASIENQVKVPSPVPVVHKKVAQQIVDGKQVMSTKRATNKKEVKKKSRDQSAAEKNLRQLFLAIVTESPEVEADNYQQSSEYGTSLRRLRRSSGFGSSGMRSSRAMGSEWKSIGATEPAVKKQLSNSTETPALILQRRLAELNSIPSSSTVAPAQVSEDWASKSKSKIKRIVSNASVFHSPRSAKSVDSQQSAEKLGTVIAGTPARANNQLEQNDSIERFSMSQGESNRVVNYFQNLEMEKPSDSQTQVGLQPGTSTTSSAQQVLSAPTPQTAQTPQINLAFSAPTKTVSSNRQQNESKQLVDNSIVNQTNQSADKLDLKRQTQVTQQQQQPQTNRRSLGNRLQTRYEDTSNGFSNTQSHQGSQPNLQVQPQPQQHLFQQQQQRHLLTGPANQQQQMVVANNADIQSAATGGNMAFANSAASSTLGGGQTAAAPPRNQVSQSTTFASLPGRLATLASGQIGVGSLVRPVSVSYAPEISRSLSPDLISLFSSILGLSASGSTQRAGTTGGSQNSFIVPMLTATSQDRQSILAAPSNAKAISTQSQSNGNQISFDRFQSSSGQQSSGSFNEDLIPAPQSAPVSASQQSLSQVDSGGDRSQQQQQQQMFGRSNTLTEQQQMNQADNSQSSFTSDPLDSASLNEQQAIQEQQNSGNFQPTGFENSFSTLKNNQPVSEGYPSIDQTLRFNSKLSPEGYSMQPFNQTENTVAENSDSSLDQQVGAFSGQTNLPQQLQSNDFQLLAAQSNQPISSPLGFDLQQLRATFSNIDQHQRFNQQLREAAAMNAYNSISHHPSYSHLSSPSALSYRRPNGYSSYQQPPQDMYNPVDEDAAAGTLAAAGIPTYPTSAQLMAIHNYGHHLSDMDAMKAPMSQKREAHVRDDKKGTKKKEAKQVSHHYHFNNLASPFEDPDNSFPPFNPLDIAANQAEGQAKAKPQKSKTNKPKDEEEEAEEEKVEKSKKRGFLKRFSLKKLFKRFRKEKVKETGSDESKNGNGAESSDR